MEATNSGNKRKADTEEKENAFKRPNLDDVADSDEESESDAELDEEDQDSDDEFISHVGFDAIAHFMLI